MSLTEEMEGRASANGADNEILARTSIFRFVPQEQQSRLKRLFKRTHYEFGELITKQNDPADAFFVILSGRARVVRTDESGQELSLNSFGAGAEFGESALLIGRTRNATVRCSSSVDMRSLELEDILRLAEEFPQITV